MSTLLSNLQQKSDAQKVVLAMVSAVFVSALLFVTWGYNFAHSGKINNLASSAVGVTEVVESANLSENFSSVISQLKTLSGVTDEQIVEEVDSTDTQDSVGAQHINVFANPDTFSDTEPRATPAYGEGTGDIPKPAPIKSEFN